MLWLVVFALFLLPIACGPKGQKVETQSKEAQLQKAQRAFEELEREAPKPAKELTLEEEKPLQKVPVPLEQRKEPTTKYPMKDGLPIWVHNPNYGGVLGGVGIAKKVPGKGYAEQKRLAKDIAVADLAKQIELIVKTELSKVEINVDTSTLQYYKKVFSSYSEQEVRSILIRDAVVEDEWIDPKTGELYVWVVIKR